MYILYKIVRQIYELPMTSFVRGSLFIHNICYWGFDAGLSGERAEGQGEIQDRDDGIQIFLQFHKSIAKSKLLVLDILF